MHLERVGTDISLPCLVNVAVTLPLVGTGRGGTAFKSRRLNRKILVKVCSTYLSECAFFCVRSVFVDAFLFLHHLLCVCVCVWSAFSCKYFILCYPCKVWIIYLWAWTL